eukprot:2926253-Amphidinium_carterae.1
MKNYQKHQKWMTHSNFEAFTPEQQDTVTKYTDAFHCSRALQYTLTKVTKGDPYKFVVQCNHNNSSGFETWRRLHITYDQGDKAQQLSTLSRIMKPTWNNNTQQPSEFIRQFQNWRDEIFNYESNGETRSSTTSLQFQTSQELSRWRYYYRTCRVKLDHTYHSPSTWQTPTLRRRLLRSIEEYYRNVYLDNNYSTGVNYFTEGGKYGKRRDKGKKGNGDYSQPKGKGYTNDYSSYSKSRGKGGKYGSRPYNVKGRGKGYKGYNNYSSYGRPKGSYGGYYIVTTTTTVAKAKEKDQKANHHTQMYHNFHSTLQRKGLYQRKRKQQPCVLPMRKARTHFRQMLVERKSLQHRPITTTTYVVSTERQSVSTTTPTTSSIISIDYVYDTATADKARQPTAV